MTDREFHALMSACRRMYLLYLGRERMRQDYGPRWGRELTHAFIAQEGDDGYWAYVKMPKWWKPDEPRRRRR